MAMGRLLAGAAANPTDDGAVRGFKVRDLVPDDVEGVPIGSGGTLPPRPAAGENESILVGR